MTKRFVYIATAIAFAFLAYAMYKSFYDHRVVYYRFYIDKNDLNEPSKAVYLIFYKDKDDKIFLADSYTMMPKDNLWGSNRYEERTFKSIEISQLVIDTEQQKDLNLVNYLKIYNENNKYYCGAIAYADFIVKDYDKLRICEIDTSTSQKIYIPYSMIYASNLELINDTHKSYLKNELDVLHKALFP